jgi:hypothetical protein
MQELLSLCSSGTMHAAAQKQGIPAADQYLFKKIPRPPSL